MTPVNPGADAAKRQGSRFTADRQQAGSEHPWLPRSGPPSSTIIRVPLETGEASPPVHKEGSATPDASSGRAAETTHSSLRGASDEILWDASAPLAFDDVPKVLLETRKRVKLLLQQTHARRSGIPPSQTEALTASLQACLNVLRHEQQSRPSRYSSGPLVRILECLQENVTVACASDPGVLCLLSYEAERDQIDADVARGRSKIWAKRKLKPSDIGYSVYKSSTQNRSFSSSVGVPTSWSSTFSRHIRTFRPEDDDLSSRRGSGENGAGVQRDLYSDAPTSGDGATVRDEAKCLLDWGIHSHELKAFSRADYVRHLNPLASSLVLQTARTRALYRCWLHAFLELIRIKNNVGKLRKAIDAAGLQAEQVVLVQADSFLTHEESAWQQEFVQDATNCMDAISGALVGFPEVLGDLIELEALINDEGTAVRLLSALASTLSHISALMNYMPGYDLATEIETERMWISERIATILRRCVCWTCRKELAAFVRKCCGSQICMACLHRELTNGLLTEKDVGLCDGCGIQQKLSRSRVWSLVPWIARVIRCCLTRVGFWTESHRTPTSRGADPLLYMHPGDPFSARKSDTNQGSDTPEQLKSQNEGASDGLLSLRPSTRATLPTATSLTPLPDMTDHSACLGHGCPNSPTFAFHEAGGHCDQAVLTTGMRAEDLRRFETRLPSALPHEEQLDPVCTPAADSWTLRLEGRQNLPVEPSAQSLQPPSDYYGRSRQFDHQKKPGLCPWASLDTKPGRLAQKVLDAAWDPALFCPAGPSPITPNTATTATSDGFDYPTLEGVLASEAADWGSNQDSQWASSCEGGVRIVADPEINESFLPPDGPRIAGQSKNRMITNRLKSLKASAFETDALVASLLECAFGEEL